ncbi:uncharacterized protein gpr179 isoform X2 [Eucyclogobius newberryi]|uniref:uncharacterized protein gpr179 isoform X2 n=1 Tax=Eucyclogobius newberryi TaxID=166745 RepID=UPI003B5AC8E1
MAAWIFIFILGLFPFIYKAQTPSKISNLQAYNSTLESTNSTTNVTFVPATVLATTPSIATTTEKDDWSPAENYLYTGDSTTLEMSHCNRAYSATGQDGPLPYSFDVPLRPAMDALANTANFLNMIYQASDLRESTVEEDMEWYHALVRALVDADSLIQKAYLTYDADPAAQTPQLVLRATRHPMAKIQTIILQDLSKYWDTLHLPAPAPDDSWFRSFKFPVDNRPVAALSKRVLLNDLSTLETPKWRQSDSYVTNRSGVRWASAPFLDCEDGRFVPGWMLTLSASYYGLKPDLTPEFRGVIRVDVNIQDIDVDQCAAGNSWFADTHQCNRTSMECVPNPGRGFRLGQYCCRCKEGFYNPEISIQDPDALPVNSSEECYPSMPLCLPCFPGCGRCQDGTPCRVQEDWLLRTAVLCVQGVFMALIFVSMMAAYRHRRNKRIRASGLLLLEIILFGSLLLYFPVFIMYFRPSTFRCILLRWVRMLGFSIVYGTVTLKMYRVLKVFLSRTAQRVPYMSSLHLMRILAVMLMTVSWFLCAWTVGVLQNRDRNIPVYTSTTTSDGQAFNLCYLDRWDYMMAVAELLFLCWGSSLWTAVRPVPSAFHEPRYMGIAIHNELLLSTMFHLFRFTFPSLHPDWMLLLCFTHTHFTITVTLALLFLPKFLFVSKPGRQEIAAEVYEDEVDLRRSYLNNSFNSAWSEHSVDPEDFRDELKKLYAQLEVHKTKKMAANNPHLPKKRSSRCAIGRSIIKRIAEFPETVSRQCSRDDREGSFRSRSICHSDSFRRSPDNASISYRSSILTPTPSFRKSQSDHHPVQEIQPCLRDSSRLRPDMMKRCSQRSETDSLDMTPGVCKSASAQNLTIDTNLLYPDHMRLHKTRSLTTTPTHSVENIAKVERSNSMLSRQVISIGEQTRSALQSESFDKSEICPWDVEPDHSTDKNQKHVTIANSSEEREETTSPVKLVCPWDHLPPPVEKKPFEDLDPPKPPLTVSASAPATPRPKVGVKDRGFSFRAVTSKLISAKSFVESIDSAGHHGSLSHDHLQKSYDGAATISRLVTSSSTRRPSDDRTKTLQMRSMTTVDGKPNLVKQNAIRLSSGDSSDRSPIRLAVVRSTICPWDIDDVQREATYENISLLRRNSRRSSGSSWDTTSHSRTPSMHRRGSKRLTPARNVGDSISEMVNVCPWESQEQDNIVTRTESGRGNVCPWETQTVPTNKAVHKDVQAQQSLTRSTDICPWELPEPHVPVIRQDSEYANVCPWVSQKPEVVYENLNRVDSSTALTVPQKQPEVTKATLFPGTQKDNTKAPVHLVIPGSKLAESCPWDFPDPPPLLETICPWEEGSMETSLTVTKKDSTTQMTIKVDVCPWESEQQQSLEDDRQSSSVQGKDIGNICPWETEQPVNISHTKMSAQEKLQSQEATYANVCPWETEGSSDIKEEQSKQSLGENVGKKQGPMESEDLKVVKTQASVKPDVCPWEKEEPKMIQKQDSSGSSGRGNVCPWETHDTKVLQKQNSSKHSNVCPWETEGASVVIQDGGGSKDAKMMKKQDSTSSKVDVCPWEIQDPKLVKKQESVRADACPWEEESKVTKVVKEFSKQDSGGRVNVCPWESEEPQIVQKQDSGGAKEQNVLKKQNSKASSSGSRSDLYSRESEQPKVLEKQESRAKVNVCPWESEEPKVVKKQESISSSKADVCPWEIQDPKVVKKQESISSNKADVCPWEIQDPKVVKKQESISSNKADVCPWEIQDPKVVKKQESISSNKADVCPWEIQDPKVVKKQESISSNKADVCPWEIQDPKVVKKQESISSNKADVCPWEIQDPKVVKKQESISKLCPWESDEPQVVKKQDSEGTKEQKVLKKQESSARGDLCPWESEETKVVKKQDSSGSARGDVCPWEMEDSEGLKKQDSGGREDVCPWETEEQIVTPPRQDSSGGEVRSRTHSVTSRTLSVNESPKIQGRSSIGEMSPEQGGGDGEEAKANLALGRRDALSPWDMSRSRSGSFTDNTSDVFTWEPENIPEEEEDDGDAESAAEAFVFPSDL